MYRLCAVFMASDTHLDNSLDVSDIHAVAPVATVNFLCYIVAMLLSCEAVLPSWAKLFTLGDAPAPFTLWTLYAFLNSFARITF